AAGISNARVRVSAFTSGTATCAVRASVVVDPNTESVSNRRRAAMASTNGTISTGTVASTVTSVASLFKASTNLSRFEIVRIDVTMSAGASGAGGDVQIRGAFITADGTGGTVETANPVDRDDTLSTSTFRAGATGAPTRVAGDLITWVSPPAGGNMFRWESDSPDKRIILRANQAEGFEIRTVIGGVVLTTASQVAVTFYWTE